MKILLVIDKSNKSTKVPELGRFRNYPGLPLIPYSNFLSLNKMSLIPTKKPDYPVGPFAKWSPVHNPIPPSCLFTEMSLMVFFASCFLFFNGATSVSVAPNDAEQFCLDNPYRKIVPDTQKVVVDTQNYREQTLITVSGANMIWNSENFDGIIDPAAIDQVCYNNDNTL